MPTPTVREEMRVAAGLPQPPPEPVLQAAIPGVYRFILHESALLQNERDLDPSWLAAEEVLDEVVAYAREPNELPVDDPVALGRALQEYALEVMTREADLAIERAETEVSLDEDIPEQSEIEEVRDQGEHIYTFWQMDEDLYRSDVFADPDAADPVEWLADREARHALTQALFTLNQELRRVFSAVVIDGWAADASAAAMERPLREIEGVVAHASDALAALLSRGGSPCTVERVHELYAALGERLRAERIELER